MFKKGPKFSTLKKEEVTEVADPGPEEDGAAGAVSPDDSAHKAQEAERVAARQERIKVLQREGRLAEIEPLLREALAERRRHLGDTHPDTLKSVSTLGRLLQVQGKLLSAKPFFEEALAGRRQVLGSAHPYTLNSMNDLGLLYKTTGAFSCAEPLYVEGLAGRRAKFGDSHPKTLTSMNNLGALYYAQGRLDAAEPLAAEALAGRRANLGDVNPETLQSINNFGMLLHAQGRAAEAEPLLREALAGRRLHLGATHPDVLFSSFCLGAVLKSQGKEEAETLVVMTVQAFRLTLGDDHPLTHRAVALLANFLGKATGPHGANAKFSQPPTSSPVRAPQGARADNRSQAAAVGPQEGVQTADGSAQPHASPAQTAGAAGPSPGSPLGVGGSAALASNGHPYYGAHAGGAGGGEGGAGSNDPLDGEMSYFKSASFLPETHAIEENH